MDMDDRIFNDGKISKILLKFAIPAIISLLVAELYNMVDTVFVGRNIGADAIGALTVAFPIQRFIISLGMLIAVGTCTFVARSLGKGDKKELTKTILNSILITFLTLVLISILIFIFKTSILNSLGASSSTFSFANEYVSIILIGGIFQCLTVVLCYIMTALGNTKITLYANSIGAIINIIIDFLLVSVFNFGVSGAAIATVFSQIIAFIFAVYNFKKVKVNFNLKFSFSNILKSLDKNIILGIIAVGFSTFIIEISDAIVAVVLNNLLSSTGGDNAIVIVGVITKVSMFMFITIIGISSAMQPIVSYNYGKGNYKNMKKALKVSLVAVTLASLVFYSILMIFSSQIIGFFLKDETLLSQAILAFRICISCLPAVGLYYIAIYYYQAIGEAKKSFLLSIYRQILIFIPIVFILVYNFGIIGAWIAYPVSDLVSSLTSFIFIKSLFNQKFVSVKSKNVDNIDTAYSNSLLKA